MATTARVLSSVIVVLLAVWWLLRSGQPGDVHPPSAATPATAAPATPGEAAALDAGAAAAAPERAAVGDARPTLRVRVRSASGEPVPARVLARRALRDAAALQSAESRRLAHDHEAWFAKFGQSITADADGRAAFALAELPAQRYLTLCARHQDQYAEVYIAADQATAREHEIVLANDREFAVVLRDAHGAPAPDVVVVAQWLDHDAMFDRDGLRRHTVGITDAEGRVHARHAQTWREQVKPKAGGSQVTIVADLPGLEAHGVALDVDHLPAEPVQLVLPPLGALAVELVGYRPPERGHPETSAVLRAVAPAGSATPPAHQITLDAEGHARWPAVALGRTWHLSLRPELREQELAGPTREGETITARFARAVPLTVTGRLWHAAQPVAERRFRYHLTTGRGIQWDMASTDAAGRFRLVARTAAPGQSLVLHVDCSVPGAAPTRAAVACSAQSAPALSYASPTTDVGDLHLTPAPLLVAGRLVGDPNRQQTRVWIRAAGDAPRPQAELDASGAFACYGAPPPGPLALLVHSPAHEPVPAVPFAPGARDLEIPLRAGATLHADFTVGEEIAYITLAPVVLPSGRERSTMLAGTADANDIDHEGIDRARPCPRAPETLSHEPVTFRYRWQGLPAGRYRLAMRGYGHDTELHGADFELTAGEHRALPAVDLRAGVRHVRVRLRDVDFDAPSQFGSHGYLFALRDDVPQMPGIAFDNQLAFLALREPLDLQIDVKGYRRQVLRGITDHVEVTLQPGIKVQITAQSSAGAGDLLLYLAPAATRGRAFSPASGGTGATDMTMPALRAGEGFMARVCAPGAYRLTAYLRDPSGYVHPCAVEPAEFAVLEAGLEVAVAVRRR